MSWWQVISCFISLLVLVGIIFVFKTWRGVAGIGVKTRREQGRGRQERVSFLIIKISESVVTLSRVGWAVGSGQAGGGGVGGLPACLGVRQVGTDRTGRHSFPPFPFPSFLPTFFLPMPSSFFYTKTGEWAVVGVFGHHAHTGNRSNSSNDRHLLSLYKYINIYMCIWTQRKAFSLSLIRYIYNSDTCRHATSLHPLACTPHGEQGRAIALVVGFFGSRRRRRQ